MEGYVVAILLIYLISSALIHYFSWRYVFFFSAAFLLLCSILWIAGLNYADRFETTEEITPENPASLQESRYSLKSKHMILLLLFVGMALVMQGVLRDGLIAWVPTYVANIFQIDTSVSIFVTTLLPVINLFGVYAAEFIRKKSGRDEVGTSLLLFLIAVAGTVLLTVFSKNLAVTLLCFGIVTSCMLGVNTMLVSMLPTYFAQYGKVSFVSGLLNSCVYIGLCAKAFSM